MDVLPIKIPFGIVRAIEKGLEGRA